MPTRQQQWDALGGQVDVLVIGGGVTGCGIARDAARRGLSVALVEMQDFAYGTSSRSSKLVHGGLRYLEQYEFSLVFEAVSERRILLDIAPHLVNPLGFLFPVYQSSRQPLWFINAGMWVYEGLSLFRSPKMHRTLKPKDIKKEEPALNTTGVTGAPLYYDCATDDARLTLETAMDAVGQGATLVTRCKAVSFVKEDDGRVKGAVVENGETGELREVRAHVVINATGPWTDRTVAMSKPLSSGALLRPTKGIHFVVERDKLPVNTAVVCLHPEDGRVLFAIPWGTHTYIGTTDTDYKGDPGDVAATRDDVDYLIEAAAYYFPENRLSYDDVISTWAGLRPLMAPPRTDGDMSESAVSREHQIVVGQDGLITIAGGKLTTYRRMAGEVVDTAVKLLRLSNKLPVDLQPARTDTEPLPGAVGWPEDDDVKKVVRLIREASDNALDETTAALLANTYGMRGLEIARMVAANAELGEPICDGRPEIMAQVDWAVAKEMACEVSDVFIRRTQVFYRDRNQGLDAVEKVGARMASLLSWSDERREGSMAAYRADVELSRQWRSEEPTATDAAES